MAENFVINGVNYPFPDPDEEDWGQQVVDWATAVTNALAVVTNFVQDLAADPIAGDPKQFYYHTGEARLKFWNGAVALGVVLA